MLNYATIGSSWITEQMINAAQLTQRYHLTAVYSRYLDTAKQLALKYEADYFTNELNNILYDPKIDVIYIASPNSLHFKQAMQAVKAKKHVIIEKPMVTSSAQWHELYSLADEVGVYVFEAALHYHSRNYSRLKPLIKHKMKELEAPLYGANFNMGQYSSRYETYLESKEKGWQVPNVFNADFEGGSLMDLGVYPLYIALDLFGLPESVHYHALDDGRQIDLFGTIILKYPQTQVSIFLSKTVHSMMPSEFYIGKETFIINDISRLTKVSLVNTEGKKAQIIDYLPANPMFDELLSFSDMILEEKTIHKEILYENWRQLSLQVVQVLELLRQSAKLY
ncbi:Gfo/Idh/MocA family protein [Facklamia sp. 7083-14-GEN3]|uniref:Gfo/Idh/MocA family oxidoreductase n=1 Tax=Facklamia sp. 7083-14-GEN3 TaxID=2973478 RepID=UPI00215C5A9C|nr:Gfo/Idh/MocA family oxidoreductase [Facklamia sp. 7083-14-GEN3]MCR8969501.1 Gfo/Idh/MocA family oxidoreductase [Facklamia sp. 7083-14-GEN3]